MESYDIIANQPVVIDNVSPDRGVGGRAVSRPGVARGAAQRPALVGPVPTRCPRGASCGPGDHFPRSPGCAGQLDIARRSLMP